MSAAKKSVAILGLGIIGEIWANHLAKDGNLAGTWNRTAKPDAPKFNADPAAAIAGAELVVICVSDPAAVMSVIEAIKGSLKPSQIVQQSSTIDPDASDACKAAIEEVGARYLEAPFTGSKPAAQERQTVFYLGAEQTLVEEVLPTISAFSAKQLHIGTNRQACTLKLAFNMQIAMQAQALCESLFLAREAGISDDTFFSCLESNVAHSKLTDLKRPKLEQAEYSPQFSIKHMLKDIRLAVKTANGEGRLPQTERVVECFTRAADAGFGDEDFAAIYRNLK